MSPLREYLEDAHDDNYRLVFRHFALSYHDKATLAAEATEAAGAQGFFWEMHDLLFERQSEWTSLTPDAFVGQLATYAAELGLDTEEFSADLENHTFLAKVNADTEGAIGAGLPGTPSYIVNGVIYPSSELGLHPLLVSSFPTLMKVEQFSTLPPQVLDDDKPYVATITTSKGDMVVELYSEHAPTNANSFAYLAGEGWYDGQSFFAVDHSAVAQAGDPLEIGWGLSFPGYFCSDEIVSELGFNEPGMLALYSLQAGYNSSQFFITYVARPDLNGGFTIIGRVIEGMDVLQALTETVPDLGQPEPDVILSITIDEQ